MTLPAISTCFWFDHQAEQAAILYCSLFDDAHITDIFRQGSAPDAPAFTVSFTLMGQQYWDLHRTVSAHCVAALGDIYLYKNRTRISFIATSRLV